MYNFFRIFLFIILAALHAEVGARAQEENDLPVVSIDDPDLTVDEDASSPLYIVTLTPASDVEVTVRFTTTEGTATEYRPGRPLWDYLPENRTLTFAAGETEKRVRVIVRSDKVHEETETFTVALSDPTNAVLGTAAGSGTIIDDDPLEVRFSATRLTIDEGESASYTAVLGSQPTANVTLTVGVPSGTDVSVSPSELTFTSSDWNSRQSIEVSAANDADALADPLVDLDHTVGGGNYDGVLADSVTVWIVEAADKILNISDVTDSEDTGLMEFEVTLAPVTNREVTVMYATTAGTAREIYDFVNPARVNMTTLTFSPGDSSETISIAIVDNDHGEPEETFTVTLSDATNATIGTAVATGTIIDDDESSLKIDDVFDNEGAGSVEFTVELSKTRYEPITVDFTTEDGTATAGSDYTTTRGTLTFDTGPPRKTISVPIIDDAVPEAQEQFTVTLSNPTNATIERATGTADIYDLDTVGVSIAAAAEEVEEGNPAVFTLTRRAGAYDWAVQVSVNVTQEGSFLTDAVPSSVTFPADDRTVSLSVPTEDDELDEPDGSVTATLVPSEDFSYGLVAPSSASVTILDNDLPALQVADVEEREDAGSLVFRVTLSASSTDTVTVDYVVAAGTATEGVDYTAVPAGTLTFTDEATEQTVTVPLVDDDVHEPAETVTLTLSNPMNATVSDASGTGTITDDETTPTVSLALTPPSISEDGGESTVTATLSGESSESVTVTVSASAVSPAVSGDFTLAGTTLTMAAGQTTSTGVVTITAVNNTVDAPDKTVTVSGTVSGGNGVSAPSDETLTITDDDGTPTVSLVLTPSSISENGGESTVTATLSGASSAPVVVTVSAAPDSPAVSGDFTLSGTTLTIAAGQTTSTGVVTITAVNNAVDAPDKTVTVSGSASGGNGVSAPSSQTLTITDDEGTPTVTLVLTPSSISENGGESTVTATLGGESSEAVVVTVSAAPDSPAVSGDFTLSGTTLTIAAGQTTSTGVVTITAVNNAVDAPDKTVTVSGSASGGNGVSAPSSQTLTITDDEGSPTVSLVLSPSSISENGGESRVTATLSGTSSESVVVTVSAAPDSPAVSGDFTLSGTTLTIAAGQTTSTGVVTITAVNNAVDAPDKTVTVSATVSGGNGVSAPSSQTLTITDDEGSPTVTLVLTPSSISENGGESTVTATLGGTSSESVVVTVSAAPDSPAVSGDFTLSGTTLTIAAGQTTSTGVVTITAVNNAVDAPDKTVTVSGSASGGNGVSAPSSQTLTITDDEGSPTVSLVLSPSSISENGGESTVTATLGGTSSESVVVTVSAAPDSPAVSGDFTLSGTTLTIVAGQTTSTGVVTITAVNNAVDAPDKTVTVSGSASGGNGVSAPSSQTLTITDDEGSPTVSLVLSPSSISENGGESVVTATLSGTSSESVVVTVSAAPDSPAVSGDFTLSGTTLTIVAGQTTSTGVVTITAVNNAVDAPDKTVTVSGSASGGNGVSAPSSQTLTITDDEGSPTVSLVLSPSSISENGGESTVTATLGGESSEAVVVTVSAAPDSPAVSGDFTLSGTTLTIAAGQTTSTGVVTITAVNNAVDAPDKTVTVSGSASGGNGVSAPSSQTLTITDDDGTPTVTLVLTPSSISENGGESRVTATLSGTSSESVVVTVSAAPDSPAVSGDFTLSGTTLTIAAGQTTSTGVVTITAVNNAVDAPDKTVTVSGSASGGNGVSAPSSQTLTITDDDGTPTVTLVLTPSSISENGGESRVTATLSGTSSESVVVTVSAAPDSPAVSGDFTLSGTTLTIAAGQTTSTGVVTITAVNNAVDAPDKTVTVSGSASGGNGVSAPLSQTLTITDDEGSPTVTLVLTPSSISENGGESVVTATLSGESSAPVVVAVSASADSPAVSGDFTLSGTTLTIAAGQTTSTGVVTITAVNNDVDAPDKTVTVSGSASGGNGVSAPSSQTLTITDDEGSPTVSLVLSPSSISENGGESRVTATLSGTSSESVVVTVSAAPDSPAVSGDFTLSGTTLTIAAGQTTSTGVVTITAVNNDVDAPDKTVTVSGSATGGNGVSAPLSQTLTITDDEGSPTVSLVLSPSSISENGGESRVTATLSGTSSESVVVTVSAAPDSPAVSGDFTLSGTTLTIAAGQTTSTGVVTITAVNNAVDAPDKTVTVSATVSGGNGVSAPSSQTLTITDDEGTPTVSLVLSPSSISENGGESRVTATLSGTSSESVVATVSAAPDSPAVSGDFTLSGTTLTIVAGQTTSTGVVTITAVNNAVDAPDKTVTVSGSASGGNGVSAPSSQTLTITDDEGTPTVTLVLTPSSISENGGESTVTATLGGTSSESVVVTVSAAPDSPAVSGDFTLSGTTLTIAAGQTTSTGTVTITAVNNDVDAPDKTVTVSGSASGGNGVSAPSSQTLTITDDDGTPTVSLVLSPSSISENGGESTVTATLSGTSSAPVVVAVSAAPDSPAVSGDFTLSGTTLTIAAGQTTSTGTVTITAVNNAVDAPDKTVTVSGSASGGNGVSAPSSQTLTITDDEGSPTVSLVLSPSSISENGGESTVTATLGGESSESVVVTVSAAPDSPAVSGDFTLSGTTLTIAAGQTTSTGAVTLTAVNNNVDAPDKTVTVSGTVTGGNGVSAPSSQTLTITDDEGSVAGITLSVSPQTVSEGGGATQVDVTATLDGARRTEPTLVTVSVAGDTASADDFAPVQSFDVTIAANDPSGTRSFTFTPTDDAIVEGPETLSVTGTTAVPNLTVTPAELTITDDDVATNGIALSVDPARLDESAGATEVTVTATLEGAARSSATVVTVTVAENAEEYVVAPAAFDLEIPKDATTGTGSFELTPVDDDEDEPDERVMVTGETNPLPVEPAMVTITDDDESNRPPNFGQSRYTFDLPENRSGRDSPLALGTVSADDADGDRLRYALSSGDRDRFTVSRRNGTVSYIGDGEDFESGPSEFELQVTASDGDSAAEVFVLVRVVDVPEAPEAADDRAETPEDTPKVIDVLANDHDPDGDRLRVASAGGAEHGTVTIVSGGVRYAPELNWHGEDRFTYTVADPGGLTSRASVRVTVTPVNDPPEAVDDEAETLEDVPAVVDVLANDTDVDGDPLRVVSVGPAGHGTTAMADGGVRYAPDLNWYGTDRFTYTIADPEGLTSTATVTMTVLPVNDPPEAVGIIPDQAIEEGGPSITVDLLPYFTDVDGDVLTYEAVSSDETAVTVTIAGATLTLAPVVTGTATVTVTAADPEGLTATQRFGVTVGDRLVREVLTDALAALGRGHLSSARMTIGRLLETDTGGMTRLMVAGQQLSLDAWDRMGAGGLEQTHELLFRAATLQQRLSPTNLVGTSADPRLRRPGAAGMMGAGIGGDRDRLLQGTDVMLSFGEDDQPAGPGGGRWRVWGQGDMQSFRGAPTESAGYDGDLRTAYLGLDARLSEQWLAGVAVARSGGAGNWEVGASSGRLTTDLTVLHPYLRWGGQDSGVWALAGIGRGTAENVRALNGRRGASPLSLSLGLLEGRRRLGTLAGGRVELDLRGEASWARLRTGAGEETVDGLEAGVRRVRSGVEVTLPMSGPGGSRAAPFGAVSTRHDGGAGQTGVGLEMAGGLRLRGGQVRVEAQGRVLALHTASGYEERGASVTATFGGGQYDPGLTASVRPHWGARGSGAETLWQDQFQAYTQGARRDDGGVDARLGYGMRLPGGRLLTPFGGYGRMAGSQRVQVGANLGLAGRFGGDPDSPLQVEFIGERYGRPGGAADHRITLFGIMNLGSRPQRACDPAVAPCPGTDAGAEGAVSREPRGSGAGEV